MRLFAAVALATLVVSPALSSQERQPQQAVLPRVTANALDKTKVTLPADFSTPLNLLILSFTRDQQGAAETWLPLATQLADGTPKTRTWVLPISPWEDNIYKWWLNSSMRGSLPRGQSPHYTVPLYVNKSQLLKPLMISSEKQIVILLTDRKGVVLWRSQGPASDEKTAALSAFLKTLPAAH